MQTFMDELTVTSEKQKGTVINMKKVLKSLNTESGNAQS
jgi:hypothetical protein